MADISLESILRYCAAAEPQPWYPSQHARDQGIDRDQLDPFLEKLRLAGLVRLTDWIQGLGQGYVLTPEGKRLLDSPRLLDRLREGTLPTRPDQPEETAPVRQGNTTAWDRGEAVREALLNTDTPATITQLLAVANILVFLTGLYLGRDLGLPAGEYLTGEPSVEYHTVLHQLGALSAAGLQAGQWWRLITCAFVHIGFLHLGMNLFVLFSVGPLLERMWGAARFLALYLMSALGAGCLVMMLTPHVLAAGASGALCGLLASMGVWVLLNRDYMPGPLAAAWLRNLVLNLVIISLFSLLPTVSWSGHLGGALAGAAAGFLFTFERFGSGWRRLAAMLALLFLPVLWLLVLLGTMLISGDWRVIILQHEADRQQRAWLAEQQAAAQEMQDFEGKYLPLIRERTRTARERFENDVVDLLSVITAPDPRSESIQKLLAGLGQDRAGLEELAGQLRQAGPYQSAGAQVARQAALDYVAALARQAQLAETTLRVPENWPTNLRILQEQRQQVSAAGQRWRRIF